MNQITKNPLLLETIKLLDGRLYNLSYHQQRFQISRKKWWELDDALFLSDHIVIPSNCQQGLYKVRVSYREEIEKIEILPQSFREVRSLRLIVDNEIDYSYKYADRRDLYILYEQRGACDDILIVKNGYITDTFYANIALLDGEKWYTPIRPLLPGTKRAKLMEEGKLFERDIRPEEIANYQELRLINALIDLKDGYSIATGKIVW
ncbi:MAG: hypothetical protein GY705_11200 [Bacteroidetes bacterium]|nr:hypothetical protein [Bacteroidota bacterium]